jgi:hypothetical protein
VFTSLKGRKVKRARVHGRPHQHGNAPAFKRTSVATFFDNRFKWSASWVYQSSIQGANMTEKEARMYLIQARAERKKRLELQVVIDNTKKELEKALTLPPLPIIIKGA